MPNLGVTLDCLTDVGLNGKCVYLSVCLSVSFVVT